MTTIVGEYEKGGNMENAKSKAVGIRYWLTDGIVAEVYYNGTIILTAGDIQEFYDKDGKFNSSTNDNKQLWIECSRPMNMHEHVRLHGRPHGTIWREK
jgi:hypothetical protein